MVYGMSEMFEASQDTKRNLKLQYRQCLEKVRLHGVLRPSFLPIGSSRVNNVWESLPVFSFLFYLHNHLMIIHKIIPHMFMI